MKLIAENLHIISKSTKQALLDKNEKFIGNLLKKIVEKNPDWIDFNIGPARGNFEGTMKWLVNLYSSISNIPISFDSTNTKEIEEGLLLIKNPKDSIINSTNADKDRLQKVSELAKKFGTHIIGLTLSGETGIPKTSDLRMELAFIIQEKIEEIQIENEKLYIDPLVLPIGIDQSQALSVLETIQVLKESFEPSINTIIGLSNISNGVPEKLRPLINQVFLVLAMGAGLDCAIVDIFDDELLRIKSMLENNIPETSYDKLYIDLYHMIKTFDNLNNIKYDLNAKKQAEIFKTAQILMNTKIYSNSYLEL